MPTTVDSKRRVVLRKDAEPGTVFKIAENAGGWTLRVMKPLEVEPETIKLVWKDEKPAFPRGYSLKPAAAAAAVRQDREDRDTKLAGGKAE